MLILFSGTCVESQKLVLVFLSEVLVSLRCYSHNVLNDDR